MTSRLFALCTLVASAPAPAFELERDSTGGSIHWAARADFVMDRRADESLGERRAFAAVHAAVSTVAAATPGLAVTLRAGTTAGVGYDFGDAATNQSEIVVIEEDWPFDETALGVTVVTVNTKNHEILDADIALNAARYHFKVFDEAEHDPYETRDDLQNTVTHELGHAMGLAHNPADPEVVMYPMSLPGETKKRALAADDVAGLAHLYAPGARPASDSPPPGQAPPVGCSAGGGRLAGWGLLLTACLLFRPRRARGRVALALFAAAMPGAVLASAPSRGEAPAGEAAVVATGEVIARRTHRPAGGRLLVTEVELAVRSCLKGACSPRLVVCVPGGKSGDLEQLIDGRPLPEPGELVGVTIPPPRSRLSRPAHAAVYRLGEMRDFVAFAKGLSAAGLAPRPTLPLPSPRRR